MIWQIKRDSTVVCWGTSKETMPGTNQRKALRQDGYKIYIDGKISKE